jgi:hypothetical protein
MDGKTVPWFNEGEDALRTGRIVPVDPVDWKAFCSGIACLRVGTSPGELTGFSGESRLTGGCDADDPLALKVGRDVAEGPFALSGGRDGVDDVSSSSAGGRDLGSLPRFSSAK